MGAKSSTQVASDNINTDMKTTENSNFGLLNISSDSLNGGNVNVLEILTFILISMGALYCLKVFCEK